MDGIATVTIDPSRMIMSVPAQSTTSASQRGRLVGATSWDMVVASESARVVTATMMCDYRGRRKEALLCLRGT
jgi:hypothetical protein